MVSEDRPFMDTRQGIRRQLADALTMVGIEVDMTDLSDATSLNEDLGVDSFHLTEVARHLEEAYDLRFTLVDWVLAEGDLDPPTYTVGSLLDYIQRHLAAES